MPASFSQLTTPISRDDVISTLIQLMQVAGFPTAGWQSGSLYRTLLEAEASTLSDLTVLIQNIAQGGTLQGVGDWLDLLGSDLFQDSRKAAVFTQGTIRLTDTAGVGPVTITPGQLFASDIGKLFIFSNISAMTVPLNGFVESTWQAQTAGSAYNLANSTITTLLTPIPGIAVSNAAISAPDWKTVQGADAESDTAYSNRLKAKWGTKGTGATSDAYLYYALTSSPDVTRASVYSDSTTGTVYVNLAGPSGPATPAGVAAVQAATLIPLTVKCIIAPAIARTIPINAFVLANGSLSLAQATAQANVDAYIRGVPIGGIIYTSGIVAALQAATGAYSVYLNTPTLNIALAQNEVAVPAYTIVARSG